MSMRFPYRAYESLGDPVTAFAPAADTRDVRRGDAEMPSALQRVLVLAMGKYAAAHLDAPPPGRRLMGSWLPRRASTREVDLHPITERIALPRLLSW